MTAERCDLLIVGAGPAGMRAALTASGSGLSVMVVDEGLAPGGQVYRGVQNGPMASVTAMGAEYRSGRALADAFTACSARRLPGTAVFMIEKTADGGFEVGLSRGNRAWVAQARKVLIATGALERPFPIPGWTLPGVMTAGAAQTLLKASGVVPSGPTVLAGTGPLLYLLAAQYARVGVRLAALLDTTPAANWRRALPLLPGFLASPYFGKGLGLIREAYAHPVIRNVTSLAAEGTGQLEAVVATVDGAERRIPAQTLLLHQGVVPQVNLAMAAGAAHGWSDDRLAFEPRLSAEGESTVAGLFIAGDSAGVAGADVAEQRGVLVALAILDQLGIPQSRMLHQLRAASLSSLTKALRGRAFLDRLFRPSPQFWIPADDVIVCRCEEVTAGEIRALTARGAQGPNQAKAFSRAGMGACQGRSCALSICAIMAQASGRAPGEIGHMRVRAPVKPITVGQMASMDRAGSDPER
jgi:NADPH-dependent 2,4-dienoyl-CoA reductase/sulfur reductase-like enzyme